MVSNGCSYFGSFDINTLNVVVEKIEKIVV